MKRTGATAGLLLLLAAALVSWLSNAAPAPQAPKPSPTYETPAGAARAGSTQTTNPVSRPEQQDRAAPKRTLEHVRVRDQRTGEVYEGRVDLSHTLERIAAGERYPHRNDGSVFQNRPAPGEREPALPRKPKGYYREYVHPTPGISGPGPQRIVVGQAGEHYYTPDHYQTFISLQ